MYQPLDFLLVVRNEGHLMNKIHLIVWSAVRGAFIVAHEQASRHGKPSSTRRAGLTEAAPPPVNVLPTGGQIVAGIAFF